MRQLSLVQFPNSQQIVVPFASNKRDQEILSNLSEEDRKLFTQLMHEAITVFIAAGPNDRNLVAVDYL